MTIKYPKLIIRYEGQNKELNKELIELAKKYNYFEKYELFNFATKNTVINFDKIKQA